MEYDFYKYGLRVATEEQENLSKIANSIKEEYGKDAYDEFMLGAKGAVSEIDPYENTPASELKYLFDDNTEERIIGQAEEGYVNSSKLR